MAYKNRRLSTHGGLILYIHDDFAFKDLNNEIAISHESNLFESIFVELWRKSCSYQKYILGNVYRLSLYGIDDLTSFTNEFTTLLNLLKTRSNFIDLCGDYNIDILKMSSIMFIIHFMKMSWQPWARPSLKPHRIPSGV